MNYNDALEITAAGMEAKLTGKTNCTDADNFQNAEETAVMWVCGTSGDLFCWGSLGSWGVLLVCLFL